MNLSSSIIIVLFFLISIPLSGQENILVKTLYIDIIGLPKKEILSETLKEGDVRIDVSASKISWKDAMDIIIISFSQNREVMLQSDMNAIIFSATRDWRNDVHYSSLGKKTEPKLAGSVIILPCDINNKGEVSIRGSKLSFQQYCDAHPTKKLVPLCFFPDQVSLKFAFQSLKKIGAQQQVIDFVFPVYE